jgi:hypothetical protein
MHEPILDELETREELIEALVHANATAKRTLRRTPLGVENPAWESIHQYINFLLDFLEG